MFDFYSNEVTTYQYLSSLFRLCGEKRASQRKSNFTSYHIQWAQWANMLPPYRYLQMLAHNTHNSYVVHWNVFFFQDVGPLNVYYYCYNNRMSIDTSEIVWFFFFESFLFFAVSFEVEFVGILCDFQFFCLFCFLSFCLVERRMIDLDTLYVVMKMKLGIVVVDVVRCLLYRRDAVHWIFHPTMTTCNVCVSWDSEIIKNSVCRRFFQ